MTVTSTIVLVDDDSTPPEIGTEGAELFIDALAVVHVDDAAVILGAFPPP